MTIERLRHNAIKSLIENKPGKHCDGGGLYLQVGAPGSASWVFRHRERWASIGPANAYTPEQARNKARLARLEVAEGRDPFPMLAALRGPKAIGQPKGKPFAAAMSEYLAAKSPHWAASNRARELRRYEYLFGQIPDFVALRLPEIDQDAKNAALATWNEQPKARRDVGFYIEAIIKFAETGKLRIRGGGVPEAEHHEAMAYRDVPEFYAGIAKLNHNVDDARALRFTILTGARTDEVIGAKHKAPATWREIADVEGKPTWVVPADRMKGKRTHHVPLTPQMLALLGDRAADDVPLFKVSGSNAMLNVLKTNGGAGCTVHGFRSSFSDYVIEQTSYGADLADMCIAHLTRGKVREAYQRSPQLDKRRAVLTEWSAFLSATEGSQT